jgi:hypothetical protein
MRELQADLWTIEADARCVTTNGIVRRDGQLVMGAGIALQAIRRYPDIGRRLGKLVKEGGNRPYYLADIGIISFPTKHDWRNNSDLGLIVTSAAYLIVIASEHNLSTIALTRPGCGLGGLCWPDVHEMLIPILDDRFVVVY